MIQGKSVKVSSKTTSELTNWLPFNELLLHVTPR